VAAVSVTFRHHCADPGCGATWPELALEVRRTARELTGRIGGRALA